MSRHNADIADRLEEVARLLADQHANPFRVRAYRNAAATVRGWPEPIAEILHDRGLEGLRALPDVGDSIATSIRSLLLIGRIPMLDRLLGEADPIHLLMSVPGVGRVTADRLHHELGIDSLEDLEAAAHDGRLTRLLGIGPKRLAGIRDSLAHRLGRVRAPEPTAAEGVPPVDELLDVDREYRERSQRGELQMIAPRRFNPQKKAWLPILHTHRGERHYHAMFSNTPRAHDRGKTRDWVVIYWDGDGGEHQATVITGERGMLRGRRMVAGREAECEVHYRRWGNSRSSGS